MEYISFLKLLIFFYIADRQKSENTMLEIGKINRLRVKRATQHGAYLCDDQDNEVLLPRKFVSADLRLEDQIDVFLFTDSEDRITATTQKPLVMRDEFAFLMVKDVNPTGAFLDWGLEKDLFVPFREQDMRMKQGYKYIVYVFLDEMTNRLVASSRYKRFLERDVIDLEKGQKVRILIRGKTDLGVNVIINNRYQGLLFNEDIHQTIHSGDKLTAYIKNIRPDKKIDVILHKPGFESIEPNAQKILLKIKSNKGFLSLGDHSDPLLIKQEVQMSKKAFKKAIGILYKKKIN